VALRLGRLDPDRPVLVDAHQVSDAASVVAIVLVAKAGLQRRRGVPGINAGHWPPAFLETGEQPGCGAARLRANAFDGEARFGEKAPEGLGIGWPSGVSGMAWI
jgi:hypothetical protein